MTITKYAIGFVAAVLIGGAVLPAAAEDVESQLSAQAERLTLEGHKGPSLLQPGFGVGEYSGWATAMGSHSDIAGLFTSDEARTSLEVQGPGMTPVTGTCQGGQSRIGLKWVTFDREKLGYVCSYGGGAPAGAEFDLVQARGGFFAELSQPQRAGELRYGPITLRAQTRYISGIPLSSRGASSYVVTRADGTPIAGLQVNGLRPVFWLPRQKGPERDAAAVLLLTLFTFQDPGRKGGFWPF